MARRDKLGFTAIRTEGGLLPPSILSRIHRLDPTLGGLNPEEYGLSGTKIREAASQAWNALQGPWRAFQAERAQLAENEAATGMTRRKWLDQVLKALDYGSVDLAPTLRAGDRTFAISHLYKATPMHLIGCGLDLEKRTKGAAGAAAASPHGIVQLFLNADDNSLWGFLSNGLRWRVLRDSVSLSRLSYVEFDLEAILEGQLYDEFLLFWLVCHQTRVKADRPEECWLEKWHQAAGEEGKRALNTLRSGVEKAIEALGQGFLRHPENKALRERIRAGELDKQDYYRQLLRMVYRLLFLFVAEDRGLLLHPNADESAKRLFTENYGTQRIRLLAERLRGSRRYHDLFVQLKLILKLLGKPEGCPELGLPALGGFLFSEGSCPDLDSAELSNADLLEAIRFLAVTQEGGRRSRVDYKNLASEEMGSVYESLLELHPDLRSDGSEFKLGSASGNERKTTGSYYTPDSLIQCLLDTALEPVVADALKRAGADPTAREAAILDLKVIDPAVGSGHFLIATAHRLAKRLAQVRSGEDEPSPEVTRHALRDVIGRCLYGIDLNPMAAELCKVALWMEALEPGKPLSFLDHHIVVGNSLYGVQMKTVVSGIPDAAFNPGPADERKLATALKLRNIAERDGHQLDLFQFEMTPLKEVAAELDTAESIPDNTSEKIALKATTVSHALKGIEGCTTAADLWCAAFLLTKRSSTAEHIAPKIPTTGVIRRHIGGDSSLAEEYSEAVEAARTVNPLHMDSVFSNVFMRGGFDVVLGNPPWVSYSGRQKVPISDGELRLLCGLYPTISAWPCTHASFVLRALEMTRLGGSVGLVLPLQLSYLDKLTAFRSAVGNMLSMQPEVLDVGENAFESVNQAVGLFSFRLGSRTASEESWPSIKLERDQGIESSVNDVWSEFLDQLKSYPRFPGKLFSDPGIHSGNAGRNLILDDGPETSGLPELREGKDIGLFYCGAPKKRLNVNLQPDGALYFRYSSRERYLSVPILLRQTASRPIATLHSAPSFFRNSILACHGLPGVPHEVLVAVLNSALIAQSYRRLFADSGQRVFPQVKIRALQNLPWTPLRLSEFQHADELSELARIASSSQTTASSFTLDLDLATRIEELVLELYQLPREIAPDLITTTYGNT
jgi:hypothetical protein